MKSVVILLMILCTILFLGSLKYLVALKSPGVYPPKKILKNKAAALFCSGGICLLLGLLLSYFS